MINIWTPSARGLAATSAKALRLVFHRPLTGSARRSLRRWPREGPPLRGGDACAAGSLAEARSPADHLEALLTSAERGGRHRREHDDPDDLLDEEPGLPVARGEARRRVRHRLEREQQREVLQALG